jgi:NAD(P)-dependent dehydrogenase (short-subunit alcohol dehydrogenase family)
VDPRDKTAIVTGGASGIGRALVRALLAAQASTVVVVDRNAQMLQESLSRLETQLQAKVIVQQCDVGDQRLWRETLLALLRELGHIDIMCSNAGVARGGGLDASEQDWEESWRVNVLAHVTAASTLLPSMLEQGSGYFLSTASAAGLLTNLGAAPYSVTKHAVVGFAEWLAITYRSRGIRVSCLCPQGVRTPMLFPAGDIQDDSSQLALRSVTTFGDVREPDEVAELSIIAMREERFLVLPHLEVHDYIIRKSQDPERWIASMARYAEQLSQDLPGSA